MECNGTSNFKRPAVTTTEEQMRVVFEMHCKFKMQMQRDDRGKYLNERVQLSWEAFEAAKESSIQELEAAKQRIAELKAQLAEAQKVPEGWQLVPKRCRQDMWFHGQTVATYTDGDQVMVMSGEQVERIYEEILAAAPTHKKE
jgi:hypothetical protein